MAVENPFLVARTLLVRAARAGGKATQEDSNMRHRRTRTSASLAQKRLAKLWLEPLEDRFMPSVLQPGESWSDAFVDDQGNFHDATVSVTNNGPGVVDASGGNGTAIVSPVEGSGHYIYVDGNCNWVGDATGYLTLFATGNVSSISITGGLWISAGGSVGNLSASAIDATAAAGNIGNITASGSIGGITAGSIGEVSSAGDIGSIVVDLDITSVEAGGDIGSIYVGHSLNGAVRADGSLFDLEVPENLTAAVAVDGNVRRVQVLGDFSGSITAGGYIGGIGVQGTMTGPVSAGGYIDFVWSGGDTGPIEAGGNIGAVHAEGSVTGPVSAGATLGIWQAVPGAYDTFFFYPLYGWSSSSQANWPFGYGVFSRHHISADVTAGQDIVKIEGRVNISSAIHAGRHVQSITASGDMIGTVTAIQDIAGVSAGNIDALINAGRDVGSIMASGSITGSVTAAGHVSMVRTSGTAGAGTISADITAQTSFVWDVTSERGDVTASISAAGGIGTVVAGRALSGTIRAGADITTVSAGLAATGVIGGQLSASIHATGSIGSVMAYGPGVGNILGDIAAGVDIDRVGAEGNVVATITAGRSIRIISAVGDITNPITAGTDISAVFAGGAVLALSRPVGTSRASGRRAISMGPLPPVAASGRF